MNYYPPPLFSAFRSADSTGFTVRAVSKAQAVLQVAETLGVGDYYVTEHGKGFTSYYRVHRDEIGLKCIRHPKEPTNASDKA